MDETAASATARAREEAKRAAVEEAGVYLQSYSNMVNFKLKTDEVKTIAAGLLKVQDETSNVEVLDGSLLKFTVTIKALVNEISDADLKSMMQNRQSLDEMTRKYNELQEQYDEVNRQMEKLKADYDKADEAQKEAIKREVALNSEKFSALDELAKGNNFAASGNKSQALAAYDKAIQLNPQLTEAYNNRGNAYAALEQFADAERDLTAAVKLNNNSATIHNNLGSVYLSQKKFDAALKEYTRALQLDPNYGEALYNRAVTYYAQGNFSSAMTDINAALKLNPNDSATRELHEKIKAKVG